MNSCVFKGGDFFMPDFIALINKYVRSELFVLLPVLYILGKFLIAEKLNPNKVNIILLIISVLLSGLYLFSTLSIPNWKGVLFAIFTSFVQGILLTGGIVFCNGILQLTPKKNCESKDSYVEDENNNKKFNNK